mmetsp:Transcript_86211/g.257357  ORF Transcript_86211/g.257357 Transcript_86211/m.257357 type:complete len:540 (-) Transcript_86211:144-1763(-)
MDLRPLSLATTALTRLLRYFFPPSAEDMAGFDSILSCARDNDAASISQLVAMGCPPSFGNRMGQTALHIGGIWGSIEAVKVLLEARANPNAQNQLRGSSPLHACAMGRGPADKRAECAKLMIAAKGDPRMQDLSGETPIDAAADEVVRLAMGGAPLHLHKAVQSRNQKELTDCLSAVREGRCEVTLDTQNQAGDTALHLAVDTVWREGVQLLLGAGSSVNLANYNQQTALHLASLRGHHHILQLLLEQRASANCKDVDPDHDPRFRSTSFEERPGEHRTPLHYASQLGNVVSMGMLLGRGSADPNSRDSRMETPLHLCLQLREPGAPLEVGRGVRLEGLRDRPAWNGRFGSLIGPQLAKQGSSEFRWPVLLDSEAAGDAILLKEANLRPVPDAALDLLLAARADVNLGSFTHGESRTVLHEAARTGDLALASRCLEARADVNRQDAKLGLAALHMAARGKHHEVARLLVQSNADVDQVSGGGKKAHELARVNGCPEFQLPIYRGEEGVSRAADEEPREAARPQGLDELTPEQRALLFID